MSVGEPTRVLFLIPSLRGGGAERVIVTLLRHLDRTRFRLTLAVVDMRGEVFRDDVPDDIELIDLGCSRVRYAIPRIVRLIWQRRPHVVFATLGHLNLALAIIRPFLPNGVRYVARESSIVSEVIRHYRRPRLWRWAYRRFYSRFDKVVCQSLFMRDDLVMNFALPLAKAVVIGNPVDTERIRRLSLEPLDTGYERNCGGNDHALIQLVTAGRLSYEKGFDLLIEALALSGDPRLRLTILGEGPLRGDLECLAQAKCVAKQVRFVGFQRNPYPFLAQADVFVLSSRYEGLPNVALEAIACGTPIIVTPACGGTRELVQGLCGCEIAEHVSSAALASSIAGIVALGLNRLDGRALVEQYSVERIAHFYSQVLLSLS